MVGRLSSGQLQFLRNFVGVDVKPDGGDTDGQPSSTWSSGDATGSTSDKDTLFQLGGHRDSTDDTSATAPPTPAPKATPVSSPAAPTAPASAQPTMKPRTLEGADFSDDKQMKNVMEKFGEVAHAQGHIIEQASAKKSKKFANVAKELIGLQMAPISANEKRRAGYKKFDEALVESAYNDFKTLIKKLDDCADKLTDLYQRDLEKRLKKDNSRARKKAKKINKKAKAGQPAVSPVSSSESMKDFLEDDFFKMAQMGLVMAEKYREQNPNTKKLTKKMELGEIAAIYGYSTQDYTSINAQLRGTPVKGIDAAKLSGYIDACVKGLASLPAFTGAKVVRCEKSAEFFLSEVVSSGKRTESAFMSTGLTKVPGFGDVEIYISPVTTGKEITAFSLHQKEGEVLFPPNSEFQFEQFVPPNGKTITDTGALGAAYPDGKNLTSGKFYFRQVK